MLYGRITYILRRLCNISGMYVLHGLAQMALQSVYTGPVNFLSREIQSQTRVIAFHWHQHESKQ